MSMGTAEGARTGSEVGGAAGADTAAMAAAAGAGAEAAGASADFPLVSGASEAPPAAAGVAV